MLKRDTYFYILTDGQFMKVGITVDVRSRIRTLQTGNPRPIRLLHRRRFRTNPEAKEFESEAIEYLSSLGLSSGGGTEWFDYDRKAAKYIRGGMRHRPRIIPFIIEGVAKFLHLDK